VWSASDRRHLHHLHSHSSKLGSVEPTFNEAMDISGGDSSSSEESVNSTYALLTSKPFDTSNTEVSTSTSFSFPYNPSLNEGSRAFEAFVRPSPVVIAGIPKAYGFDMRSCSFSLRMVPFKEVPPEDSPTEIFVPEYFFQDCEPEISVSSGRWIMHRPGQLLRWWHSDAGEQKITISSAYKKDGVVGTVDDDIEGWYYWYGKCLVM
jgi:Glycoside hydrolase family 5 C-terminal domain